MNSFGKNLALWVIIALLVVALFNLFNGSGRNGGEQKLAFSDFIAQIESGQVADVTIEGNKVSGTLRNGRPSTPIPPTIRNLCSA